MLATATVPVAVSQVARLSTGGLTQYVGGRTATLLLGLTALIAWPQSSATDNCNISYVTELVTEAALDPAALGGFCASTSSRGRAPPKGLARGARGLGACSPSPGSAAALGSSFGGGASTCEITLTFVSRTVAALIGTNQGVTQVTSH